MKYILWITLLFISSMWFVLLSPPLYSNECSYDLEIQQCVDANLNGSSRQIENFLCIEWTKEQITYQIILDNEFKRIDDNIDTYLTDLEKNKNRYFGQEKTENYIDGVNEIERNFSVNGKYWREFNNVCGVSLIKKVQSCQRWETSIDTAKDFFKKSRCMDLVETKLHISRQVAYNIMTLNKQQILKDEQKKYVQQERTKYDKLLDAFMINLGYLERIFHKWPSKITNPAK